MSVYWWILYLTWPCALYFLWLSSVEWQFVKSLKLLLLFFVCLLFYFYFFLMPTIQSLDCKCIASIVISFCLCLLYWRFFLQNLIKLLCHFKVAVLHLPLKFCFLNPELWNESVVDLNRRQKNCSFVWSEEGEEKELCKMFEVPFNKFKAEENWKRVHYSVFIKIYLLKCNTNAVFVIKNKTINKLTKLVNRKSFYFISKLSFFIISWLKPFTYFFRV